MSNAPHTTSFSADRATRVARAREIRQRLNAARSASTRLVCNSTTAAVIISSRPSTIVTSTTLFLATNLALQLATSIPLAHVAALMIGVAILRASPSPNGSALP